MSMPAVSGCRIGMVTGRVVRRRRLAMGASSVRGEGHGRQAAQVVPNSRYSFNRDRHPAGGLTPGGVTSGLRTRPGTRLLNGLLTRLSTSDAPVDCLPLPARALASIAEWQSRWKPS